MRRKVNQLKTPNDTNDSCFNVLIYNFYCKYYVNKVEKRNSMLKRHGRYENQKSKIKRL